MFCTGCGNKLTEGDAFCNKCGAKTNAKAEAAPAAKAAAPAPAPKAEGYFSFLQRDDIKKYFTIATIALVTICAVLIILMVFVGSLSSALSRAIGSCLILYIAMLLSGNNLVRLAHQSPTARALSVVALGFNVLWTPLWIMEVWGVNDRIVGQLLSTGLLFSIYCTMLSSFIERSEKLPKMIRVFKSLPIVCASFLFLDLLIVTWVEHLSEEFAEFFLRIFVVEIVLMVLQAVVTRIIRKNANYLGIQDLGDKKKA